MVVMKVKGPRGRAKSEDDSPTLNDDSKCD